MTVKSRRVLNGQLAPVDEGFEPPRASLNHLLAAFLWLVACVTTWQLVVTVTEGMTWYYQLGIAVALQVVFTALERPMLRGRPNRVSGTVLFLDTLINAGGVFPYALRLGATPTVAMISTAANIAPQVTPVAALALSLLLGFLLAAAPEAVWRWRD